MPPNTCCAREPPPLHSTLSSTQGLSSWPPRTTRPAAAPSWFGPEQNSHAHPTLGASSLAVPEGQRTGLVC